MLDPVRSTTTALPPVLVVDLDGTLIPCDVLMETCFSEFDQQPAGILDLLPAFRAGKAAFKRRLPAKADLLVETFGYLTKFSLDTHFSFRPGMT